MMNPAVVRDALVDDKRLTFVLTDGRAAVSLPEGEVGGQVLVLKAAGFAVPRPLSAPDARHVAR